MKVLMVSRWFWEEHRRNPDAPGFFGELVQAIVAQGIDLTILCQAQDAGPVPEPRPFDALNVHVFSREGRNRWLSPFDKIVKIWAGYRKGVTDALVIRDFVRQHGPFDAVVAQCEEPDGLACALACLAGKMPPLVTQIHGLRNEFRGGRIRFIRKSSFRFIFRNSARVVANSAQTALWLEQEYGVPQNKIGQCRVHLTSPFLNRAGPVHVNTNHDDKRILFLGALNRNKGPDIFLRAALLLAPDLPGWAFVLVGPETSEDHAFRTTVQELAAHPLLAGRLEMPGRLKPTAVIEQIRRARVVVCPSWVETFSRTTAEALALGRPVVVTETSGAAQWVKSTGAGTVVPPNDPPALARAIHEWTTREDVPEVSARVKSELTAARAAEDWIREVTASTRPTIYL
jgi:glycosyltransferase involved in cell wall biosynthesis